MCNLAAFIVVDEDPTNNIYEDRAGEFTMTEIVIC